MPPGGRHSTVPEDFIGTVHGGMTTETKEYALLDELGAKWASLTLYWQGIEPKQDEWDYSFYDAYVENGNKAGLKILGVLAYDADWIHRGGKRRNYIPPESVPLFINYVEKTVTRYKGRVDAWEIWNEPNIHFWRGEAKEFYELSRLAVEKIREVDPETPVLGGVFWRAPETFIRKMFRSGALEKTSAIAFHPYAVNPASSAKIYDKFSSILAEENYYGDIWITEIGYPTEGWYPNRVSEDNFPSYIVKTITGLAARGPRLILWYQVFDQYNRGGASNPFDSEDFFGLAYPDYSPKKGFPAYSLCSRFLAGAEYFPELPLREGIPKHIISFYFKGKDDLNILILWNDRRTAIPVQVFLPLSGESGSGGLYDIVTGERKEISAESALMIGNVPQIIVWKNIQGSSLPRIQGRTK
jgi:hypothetical protein